LTSEERLLLAMVKQDPERTAQAFDSLRKRESEPLEIAPLVIPPLETGEGQ
jgi:DNA polymerase III delta subunit